MFVRCTRSGDENGLLMYPAEMASAAAFPNYVSNRELSCAVCRTSAYGSLFTQWGKSTCPESTTRIYNHFAASARYNQGGGANFLCMHPTPQWQHTTSSDSNGVRRDSRRIWTSDNLIS